MSLYYNGANSYLFINGTEIIKFKAKDSEIVATPFCLGNISLYFFLLFFIKTNKCSGICHSINNPLAKLCVSHVVKGINIKAKKHQHLRSRNNETKYKEWHETYKYKCRLDANVCNNKQRWNKDKRRCECKELIDKGICDKRFTWSQSNCECECDKLCDIGEYLDYENFKCRKRLTDKLVEECSESIDKNEMICNSTLNDHSNVCGNCERSSCTVCIVLFITAFLIIIDVSSTFVYFYWYLQRDNICVNYIILYYIVLYYVIL